MVSIRSRGVPDEGYIKFRCLHTPGPAPECAGLDALIRIRNRLHGLGLIGVLPDGIGFGNISLRAGDGFVISASATGHIALATAGHFSLVERCDIGSNTVWCRGPLAASSESMTHWAVYQAAPLISSVIHVHDQRMWRGMLDRGDPCTEPEAAFGTPELARSVMRLARGRSSLILAMPGHEDGVMTGGETTDAALELLLGCLNPG